MQATKATSTRAAAAMTLIEEADDILLAEDGVEGDDEGRDDRECAESVK